MVIKSSVADVLGTPINQNTSGVNDLSSTSPYRQAVPSANEVVHSSPYRQATLENPTHVVSGISSIDGVALAAPSNNVVYSSVGSSQPFQGGFNGMVMGSDGNYYSSSMPMSSYGGYSQTMPSSMGYNQFPSMGGYSQFGSQPYSQFMGSSSYMPLTPRMSMQGLTPRGMTSTVTTTTNGVTTTMPVSTNTQMGLTPRSYQDQLSSMMIFPSATILPSDPSMMMFAESFKNQCLAMSQYYANNPNERPESPEKPVEPLSVYVDSSSPVLTRSVRRRMNTKPSDDQENRDTANATPVGEEEKHVAIAKMLDDEDHDEEDEESEETPSDNRRPMSPPIARPAPKSSKTVSMLQRFACGRAMLTQMGRAN